jgi:DNA-binding transcriptional MerR regulator
VTTVDSRPPRRAGRPPCCSPELAKRIRRFKDQGYSLQGIADLLNAEGVPTPLGSAPWTKSHVYGLLGRLYVRDIPEEAAS